jgi:hypothetical protein
MLTASLGTADRFNDDDDDDNNPILPLMHVSERDYEKFALAEERVEHQALIQ